MVYVGPGLGEEIFLVSPGLEGNFQNVFLAVFECRLNFYLIHVFCSFAELLGDFVVFGILQLHVLDF